MLHRAAHIPAAALGALLLYGCASGPDSPAPGSLESEPLAQHILFDPPDSRTIAFVDGRAIKLIELEPLLLELAGVEALSEAILDRLLEAEAERRGIKVGQPELDLERSLLTATLSDDPDRAILLLEEIRDEHRLGTIRFTHLLRRNALLRAMVQDEVAVNEQMVLAVFDSLHGEKRQARLIVVPDLGVAGDVMNRVAPRGTLHPPPTVESFADLAIELSTDVSAARGGLLEPIGRFDPSYPHALREAIWSLDENEVSSPVMVDGGFAILHLELIYPADPVVLDNIRPAIEQLARRNHERLLMQRLAEQLLRNTSITILDDELEAQWNRRDE